MKPGAILASPARWNSANKYISSSTPEKAAASDREKTQKMPGKKARLWTWPINPAKQWHITRDSKYLTP
jgi:hypothetical protein